MTKPEPIETEVISAESVGKPGGELAIVLHDDGTIDINEAAIRADVARFLADVDEKPTITNDATYKQAKRDRTAINKYASDLDGQRKRHISQLQQMLKDLKARVDDVLEPVTTRGEVYKAAIDDYEAAQKAKRLGELQRHYEEYATLLMDSVPYERLHDDKWLLASTNIMAAFDELEAKVNKIAKDEAMLLDLDGKGIIADLGQAHNVARIKGEYFRTLDYGQAVSYAQMLRKSEEAAAKLEAEKAAMEAERKAAAEQAMRDSEQAKQERMAARAAMQAETGGVCAFPEIVTEEREKAAETAPEAVAETQADADPIRVYRFTFAATRSQAIAIKEAFSKYGISSYDGLGFKEIGRVQ